MTTINTNVQSLNAQRNLMSSQGSLATSMQRLSSGLRVNSAKDDAAGLAISERMNAQVKGLNVAARNANDGISLAQTAEGALGKVGDMLQRVRELAVQSVNATNNATDRGALNAEAQQLKAEIDRVATTTKFNGTALLDGQFTNKAFQVGANQGETINIASIANAQSATLGTWFTPSSPNISGISGAFTTITVSNGSASFAVGGVGFGSVGHAGAGSISLTAVDLDSGLSAGGTALAAAGISFTGTVAGGDLVFTRADGSALDIVVENTGGVGGFAGSDFATGTNNVNNGVASQAQLGFATLDISDVDGANAAILAMDGALTAVNSSRGDLGASQSRFENAISNIMVTSENLSAARGRIVDADFAKETANLSRSQILQQAGTAMVAQANQLPQGVLSLLR
jgi:flagellin